jgi:hypothetical protein
MIFDGRNEVTRPTQGWNMIAKYQRVDRALGNRFEFNCYIAEVSYLYPLITRRQVIGVRAAASTWTVGGAESRSSSSRHWAAETTCAGISRDGGAHGASTGASA